MNNYISKLQVLLADKGTFITTKNKPNQFQTTLESHNFKSFSNYLIFINSDKDGKPIDCKITIKTKVK